MIMEGNLYNKRQKYVVMLMFDQFLFRYSACVDSAISYSHYNFSKNSQCFDMVCNFKPPRKVFFCVS